MCGAPGLDAGDVNRAAEVPDVLGAGKPSGLTGGLARVFAVGGKAIPLAIAVAMVWVEKEPATQALALSSLRHGRSPTGSSRPSPNGRTRAPRRSLKKTEINREEDASKTQIGRKRMAKKTHVHTARKEADSSCRSQPRRPARFWQRSWFALNSLVPGPSRVFDLCCL